MSSISDLLPKPKNITSTNESHTNYDGRDDNEEELEENQSENPVVTALVEQPSKRSNALIVNKTDTDDVDYSIIAKQGHDSNRKIQTSYNDLIPLRQRTDSGEISLDKPDESQAIATTDSTRNAIDLLLHGKIEASKPRSIPKKPGEATYVRYTPGNQMGESSDVKHRQRIIKVVDVAQDPLAPPKFKKTNKIPQRSSPPPPVLRSPPRKLTAADQADWHIPPAISNWKNPKGYTIALDKRLSSSAHGLQEVEVNDNRAKLAEALYAAERSAREEIRERTAMQKRLAEKENAEKEERLRELARRAREERNMYSEKRSEMKSANNRDLVDEYSESESESDTETAAERKRRLDREERKREAEKELRMSRMGAERRVKILAKDQDREISERVALGVAQPSKPTGEAQFDSRLFNQTSGMNARYNEDQIYDKSLFAAQEGVQRIYRPQLQSNDDEEGAMDKINSEHRFEGLGAHKHERDNDMPAREGPVEFVREQDEYGLNEMINKTYGLEDKEKGNKKRKIDD